MKTHPKYLDDRLRGGGGAAGGILPDWLIEESVHIDPFVKECPKGVISYGLTSYGYDMRIDNKYKLFKGFADCTSDIDPKNFDASCCTKQETDILYMPPHSFALGVSVETFEIPRSVMAVCVGKSTYARAGLVVNITPLEPEWRGKVTIEVSNTTPNTVRLYSGEGIAQILFFKGVRDCIMSYADKKGRYQDQKDITLPFVEKE